MKIEKVRFGKALAFAVLCATLAFLSISIGCVSAESSFTQQNNNKSALSASCSPSDLKYATNASGSWITETVDTGGVVGKYTSIALDSSDKVHISYYDSTNYDLKYATNAPGYWVTEKVGWGYKVGEFSSIAIDSSDNVHISYYDGWNGDLKYATNAYGVWLTETVDNAGPSGWLGMYSSIALDSSDNVHISYIYKNVDTLHDDLKYATNSHGSWVTETIEWTKESTDTSIAIDSKDKVHISYHGYTIIGNVRYSKLKYATNAFGTWVIEDLDSAASKAYTDIAIDSQDTVHISYSSGGWDLYYFTYVSGSWVHCVIDYVGEVGGYNSIAINSSDNPHFSYYDATNGDLKCEWLDHPGFGVIVDSAGDVGRYTSIAIDSSDNVHISYYDYTNKDLKYATNREPGPDLAITDVWNVNSTIYYEIKNKGGKRAGASNTSLTIDGDPKVLDYVASLYPGAARTESFNYTWDCTNENDTIEVCADYTDEVAESNEGNNCRTETWICLPDLEITDVWSDNNTIYYKITNAGNKKSGASETSLTVDSVFKASDYVASLGSGVARTESFNYTWNCTGANDTIKVCADYTKDVVEINEENNCRNDTWSCADIWVNPTSLDVRLPPDVVSNYTLTIVNKGTGMLKFNIIGVPEFYIRDVEKGVASARASSLDIAFNSVISSSDVVSCEHETASGNTGVSSNASIVIDDEYIAKSQKSPLIQLESIGAENTEQFWIINAIAAKVPAVKMEAIAKRPDVEKINQPLNETTLDKTGPIWGNQGQNASTIDVGASVLLYAHWSDDVGLSHAILSINESGKWMNKTIYVFNSNHSWSNFTWHNASVTAGSLMGWRIYANDSSNNWNVTDIMTFTVEDMTPPMVMFAPPTPANNSEITVDYLFINVSVNENVSIALLNWNGTNMTMNGSGKNFYLNMTNLPNGNYTYSVYANDTAGNIGVSEPRKVIVNVTAPQDTTPPASISNLSHKSGQTWINWTWSNPEDEDFEYAGVYINGTWQANTSECYYNATRLVPNASFEIGICTVDITGNVNETWVNDTAFTLTPVFSVSIISPLDGQVFKQNEVIQFHCSVSGGTHPYTFKWTSSIDGFIGDEESFNKSLSVGEHVISLTATDSSGQNDTAYVNISVIMKTKEEEEAKKEKIISATTIIVPDDYPTIQQAVDNASDGDTIFVRNGTYPENIRIDKDLTLKGEDRDTTIIDGGGSGNCVHVSSADVNISRFTIKNAGGYGVYAYSSNLNINNATISDCGDDAIYFKDGKSLTLRDSILENCGGGVAYYYHAATGNATIERNIIRDNTGSGLSIWLSSGKSAVINDNQIINNTGTSSDGIYCSSNGEVTMENNTVKISGDDGIYLSGAENVTLTNTIINTAGDDGLYVSNCQNLTINPPFTIQNVGDDGLYVSNCQNLTINPPFTIRNVGGYGIYTYKLALNLNNATISNCGDDAIYFKDGKSLTLRDSILENCGGGVAYYYHAATGNATIERNIIRDNTGSGLSIWLSSGKSAVINDNQIINNTGTSSDGIYCSISSNGEVTMENNTVKISGDDGIYLSGAENVTLTNTIIDTAGDDGLYVSNCQNLTINPPFTIQNAGGYGIYTYKLALNLNNATISNCGDDAIYFKDGKSLTLRDSILENCGGGVAYYYHAATGNATIERNIIRDNTDSGLSIWLSSGKSAVINDNQIINNTGTSSDGIYCSISSNGEVTMENNTVKISGDDGIYLSGAENVTLTNTIIDTAGDDGLYVSNCQNLTINPPFTIRNVGGYGIYTYKLALNLNNATISNCGDDAIYFKDGKSLTLRDSILENCGGGVAYYYHAATGNATIERNIIRDNTGSGLSIWLSSGKSAVINDNQIINNTGTSSDGIYCSISSNGEVTMENNTVKISGDDGIYLSGAENVTLTNTIIDTAGDDGLYVSNCQNLTINPPFTIQNAGGYGIYTYKLALNLNNATISNCGDDAIYFKDGKSLTLRDSILENCGGGVAYYYHAATGNATIERNIIRDNTDSGLSIWLSSGKSAVINDNQIINNTGTSSDGIYCSISSNGEVTMENNTVKISGDDGIYLSGAENVTLTNTIIDTAGDDGLYVSNCQNLTINPPFTIQNAGGYGIYTYKLALNLNNATISNCGEDAIYFKDGKSLTLRDSILENCGGGVAYYYHAATGNATIERNIIRDNTGSGLSIWLSSGKSAVINDNQIINNTGTSSDGIYCSISSNGEVTMENNTVKISGDDGIYLSGAENVTLTNTIIDTAGDDGLYVSNCQNLTINPPFTIQNAGGYGIYTYKLALNLNNATISNCGDDAIYFKDGKSLTLRDSILENCDYGLYYYSTATGNATIERNIIRDNTGSGLYIRLSSGKSAVINNNQIINSTGTYSDGIYCSISSNGSVTMENNTVKNSGDDGIYLSGAEDVTLTNTIIDTAGDDGVYISGVITPVLMNNTITNCGGHGVSLSITSTTKKTGKLRNNVLTNNKYGFSITGTSIESYYQDIDTSNTINGKPMYYLVEEENKVFDGIPAGYFGLVACKNMKVKNLELTNNGQGVLVVNISDSEVYFNNCSNNEDGIDLHRSNNNKIYLNNFINNTDNVYSYNSTNIWNSTEKITYIYKDKTYTNYTGNFWDDYTDVDSNNDGIWDNSCPMDSNYDYFPLVGSVSEVAGWVSVSPKIGTINPSNQTNITVTINTSGLDSGDYYANIIITSNDPDEGVVIVPVHLRVGEKEVFDTGSSENPYPSIMGTHKGEIKPSQNINVSKLYTYSCVGTGGHTESIELEENGIPIANGSWNRYQDDWHNISITPSVTLLAGHTYNYTIVTGSYPQIIHAKSKDVTGGIITCTSFVDANGKTYIDWIPAIRLE